MRSAEHADPVYPYDMPAYRAAEQYPSPAEGFRPFALASQDNLSPPSLTTGSTAASRAPTTTSSRAPQRRPFSLPPSSYPQYPTDLYSRPSLTSRGHTEETHHSAAIPPSELDISQIPSFARGWYAKDPQFGARSRDPLVPSYPNVFDPSYPVDTYRSDLYSMPNLGYHSPPPSYPSHASGSSRDYLPWSGDPPEPNGPLDSEVKEERMRMLEREFGVKGKGKDGEDHVIGSVDSKGNLITQGPKKRLAVRWLEVLLALLAGGASIYASLVSFTLHRLASLSEETVRLSNHLHLRRQQERHLCIFSMSSRSSLSSSPHTCS